MSNHVDRFYAAVSVVASHGDIKQRLVTAFEDHLDTIEDAELPIEIREAFIELRRCMTGVEPLNGEGYIRATGRKMSVDDADRCAQKMLDLYSDLITVARKPVEDNTIKIGEKPRVPPFLVKNLNS